MDDNLLFDGIVADGRLFRCEKTKEGELKGVGKIIYCHKGLYYGDVSSESRHGYGLYAFPSTLRYIGEWKDDERDGYGIYWTPHGEMYFGEWKCNSFEGRGHLMDVDAAADVHGTFEKGELLLQEISLKNDDSILQSFQAFFKSQVQRISALRITRAIVLSQLESVEMEGMKYSTNQYPVSVLSKKHITQEKITQKEKRNELKKVQKNISKSRKIETEFAIALNAVKSNLNEKKLICETLEKYETIRKEKEMEVRRGKALLQHLIDQKKIIDACG